MKGLISLFIGLLLVGGLGVVIFLWVRNKLSFKRRFIERPERGKARDILRKTNQISDEKKKELAKMNQDDLQHELNKSFKRMNDIKEKKK